MKTKRTFTYNVQTSIIFTSLQSYQIIHLSVSAIFWFNLTVRGRCSRWPVSEALPLFLHLVVPAHSCSLLKESSTCSQHRLFHRRGYRPVEEAGMGPLCGRAGRHLLHHCQLRMQSSRKQTLAERCSRSLLHSSTP